MYGIGGFLNYAYFGELVGNLIDNGVAVTGMTIFRLAIRIVERLRTVKELSIGKVITGVQQASTWIVRC